jgi:two-component sensor histidine kinase
MRTNMHSKGENKGTIEISAVQENGRIRITIRDDGVGLPDNFDISHSNSLGIKLIRTIVQHQLKGSLRLRARKWY